MKTINIIIISCVIIFLLIVAIMCIWWKFSGKFTCIKPDDIIKPIELELKNNNSKVTVYTLGTNMKKGLYNMISSLKQNNHTYKVINYSDKFDGWRWRVKQYINTLEKHIEEKNNDIVIFVDGYDAFSCKNYEGLYEKFLSFNKPIIVGSEKGDPVSTHNYGKVDEWWDNNKNYDKYQYNHKCCNAGFIMGYSNDLLLLYKWIYDNNYEDDQMGLREYIKTYPENIYMDINSEIVYNKMMHESFDNELNPYFMHFPSSDNTSLIDITMEEYYKEHINEYYSVYPIYLPHAMNVLIGLFLTIIIVIMIFCFFYIYH
jgi:hypothetical protein